MARMFFLFVIITIGIGLRYLFLGKFEWDQAYILFFFPGGALALWFIQKRMIKRDAEYVPKQPVEGWSTYLGERYSPGPKFLYKGTQLAAEYHRFYPKWWQKTVNEIVEGDGKWYMNLSFDLGNNKVVFLEKNDKKIRFNESWEIVENGKAIGQVRTDYSWKNSARLREGLILEAGDQAFYYKSSTLDTKTEVLYDGRVIARGKRSEILKSEYHFHVDQEFAEIEPLLSMTYILFNYVHNQ